MSRIEKVKRKKFFQSVFLFLLIFLIILYSFFSFGLGLIIKFSTFLANFLNNKNSQTSLINKSEQKISFIDINEIPTATNSEKIQISGNIVNLDKLEFYINNKKTKEINTNSDFFSEEIGNLIKGNNQIYILGKNKEGKVLKKTPIYSIFYKPDKPKLEIKEPIDNTIINSQEIKIIGETDKETFIKINGLPVVVDASGNFSNSVKLNEGENKITITAEDQAGNIEEKIITVFYQKED